MLTSLDHIVLVCPDFDAGVLAYANLLGIDPTRTTAAEDSEVKTAVFRVQNTALELMAPVGDGAKAQRLRDLLSDHSEGRLTSLAFGTDDLETAHHILTRRGLSPTDITEAHSIRCLDHTCAGIKTFIVDHKTFSQPERQSVPGAVTSMDHLVINTPNPERAIAHYGARLGLRFALDRTIETFKTRFLFFRIGGLTLEVIHRLDQETLPDDPDRLWGITWKVDDLPAAHNRLNKLGLDLSDMRVGRKPGTQVFTVRNQTLGIPTLFLSNI